jgi:hypothetical protein
MEDKLVIVVTCRHVRLAVALSLAVQRVTWLPRGVRLRIARWIIGRVPVWTVGK